MSEELVRRCDVIDCKGGKYIISDYSCGHDICSLCERDDGICAVCFEKCGKKAKK